MAVAGYALARRINKRKRKLKSEMSLAASIFIPYVNNVMMLLMLALGLSSLVASQTVYGGSAIGLGLIAAVMVVIVGIDDPA